MPEPRNPYQLAKEIEEGLYQLRIEIIEHAANIEVLEADVQSLIDSLKAMCSAVVESTPELS